MSAIHLLQTLDDGDDYKTNPSKVKPAIVKISVCVCVRARAHVRISLLEEIRNAASAFLSLAAWSGISLINFIKKRNEAIKIYKWTTMHKDWIVKNHT